MNKRQYKKHKKKMFKVILDSEAFRIPHAYKEYYQGRTVPMLLDGLAETVLNLVADNKENKDIYDSYHPRYFNTDTFKNAILENEKKGDAILRSAILASKDVDKNTLMLKNIAGIARNNGKDVVVLCSDERKSAWEKEETEDFTKIKDYVLTIKNNLMNDTVIANTVFILDFGKDSILNYDNNFNLKEDTLFLSTISRLHNNYVYLTSNELLTSFDEFISKYKPLHHGIYDVYQEKSGIYELLK